MENKKHFKLYKKGKEWVVAAILTVALSSGVLFNTSAKADTNLQQQTSQAQSYNHQDNGNYGWLDQANINNEQLHVAGWQATNQSVNQNNRFVIAYDQTTNKELGRQMVTNVARPDVQRVHNVHDAAESGYNSNIKLNFNNMRDENDNIQVVSRYSNTINGEGNHTDWWSQTINLDKGNYAYLDHFAVQKGQLHVSGWNATNGSINRNHHFLILFDQSAKRELMRQEVKSVARPDVAKVYPAVINAGQSGFVASFNVANLDPNHQYQLLSRYSNAVNGEGSYITYWFNPQRLVSTKQVNQGWLDNFNISKAGKLTVSGWHTSDLSNLESNRFVIIFDKTANHQIASRKINSIARQDVAKIYPGVSNANKAGFSVTFDLASGQLQPGHSYSVVSRYSADPNGNGNDGRHVDFWSAPVILNQTASNVDSVVMTDNGLRVQGWMASDANLTLKNAYIILLNNGREVTRQKLTVNIARPDVAKVYPSLYNSTNSGFATTILLNQNQLKCLNGNMQILLRFSSASDGNPYPNQDVTDQFSRNYPTNIGYASTKLDGNKIRINGWHATINSNQRPYQYLIVIGLDGHEFYRVKLDGQNSNLNSSNANISWISGAGKSGFNAILPVKAEMNHRAIKIIHRYTNDAIGNGNYIDFYAPQVDINDGFQVLNGEKVYYDPANGQIAIGWRTINGNRYYFADGYNVQPYPDDLWVYNDQLHGRMYTGINWVDGHCYDFGNDGIARVQRWNDGWSWPFPSAGEGWFQPGQRYGYSSYPRKNGFHDGTDFGISDHRGYAVHAVHGGRVLDVNTVRNDKGQNLWWFVTVWDGKYLYVYQEAFSNRNKITVNRNEIIYPGQVIGYRDLSHLHLGINTSPNYGVDLRNSFTPNWVDKNQATGHGEWLNPVAVIKNRG